jgi:5-amino-6-(5-phosphoribosylamino)uracil reductase/diaminohydroxyphosphoribosylaminopyrimidine deaminase/5-amino-6-(5-phosphoribosylamino)uracil reductase
MTATLRPRVTLHFAQSLDGKIALAKTRTPLSSRAGVALAHRARLDHDAVLVGRTTVQIDDPRLAVDHAGERQPRRIVLATCLDVPLGARVLRGGPGTLVIGVAGRAPDEARAQLEVAGVEVRLVGAATDGLVALPDALAAIRAWGVQRLLVEGGARVITSFVRQRLVDEVTIEVVPRLLGALGLAAIGDIGAATLDAAAALEDLTVERAGESIVVRGRLAP